MDLVKLQEMIDRMRQNGGIKKMIPNEGVCDEINEMVQSIFDTLDNKKKACKAAKYLRCYIDCYLSLMIEMTTDPEENALLREMRFIMDDCVKLALLKHKCLRCRNKC